MGVGGALQARLTEWMRRTNALEIPVYLRTITDDGEDRTLGIRGTQNVVDEQVVPDPWVSNVSYQEIEVSGGKIFWGDLAVLMPTTYSREKILATYAVIYGDVYMPARIDDMVLDGVVIWRKVVYSRKRTAGQQIL